MVGESGCGKSTLARLVTMIEPPTSGSLNIDGQEIAGASAETLRSLRPKVQIVFQNPYGSLNPRQKIGHMLEEPLAGQHRRCRGRAQRTGPRHDGQVSACGRSTTTATRTCSPAASASASPSPAP